ncbi:hypothetical protein GW932_02110 [archaeon]|nr:hypothetical protein [archaeon]
MAVEVIFLFVLALIWIIFATVEDIRTREIANWLNFSLVIFALGFRFFYSLFELGSMNFFYQGLIGYGIFFVLGNLFYYGKMFAGGDAKLMESLGAIIPIYNNFYSNLELFFYFILLFLFVGAIYGFLVSAFYGIKNFSRLRKEFKVQLDKHRQNIIIALVFASLFLIIGFFYSMFFYLGLFVFILPYFYLYVKSVDEACMIKNVSPSKLTLGDWLYEDVKIGRKKVKATWDGLTLEDIELLKNKEKVLIRYGVQFAPVFLISFILLFVTVQFGFSFSFFSAFGF